MFPDSSPITWVPLMTADEVKTLLGVTVDTFDPQFEFAVNVVSGLIRDYTGRQLGRTTYTDTFHPRQRIAREGGGAFLSLMEYPVVSLTSSTVNGDAVNVATRIHKSIGVIIPDNIGPDDEVVVVYVAGYQPLPYALQSVFLDLVRRQLAALGVDLSPIAPTPSPAVKAVSVGALKVDYAIPAGSGLSTSTLSPLSAGVMDEYAGTLGEYVHSRKLAATPA